MSKDQRRGAAAGGRKRTNGHAGEPARVKTYVEGQPFPGRIGRTWDVSEPAFPVAPTPPKGAPNVLYVILDDVGYGWSSTFGGLVDTPNITRLADGGLKYVNFHTTALCSPTRACLLTGRNHHSVGMANIIELSTGYPGYNGRQPKDKAAIGSILHEYGYVSFALGKWHNTASEETGPNGPYDRWPSGPVFGFDRFYGFFGGDSNQWYPKLYLDREPIDQPRLPEEGYHLSEDIVDRAVTFIGNQQSIDPGRPWLCHLAFGACHAPHHVAKEWSDKYKGRFDMGWDRYRELVIDRQKKLGVVPQNAELSPMLDGVQAWESLSPEEKRTAAWGFDEDHWELYDLEADPAETHDLMKGRDAANLKDPIVKKMIELVGLWWAEAGRHGVLPLDDRFQERLLARASLASEKTRFTFYAGMNRLAEHVAPSTLNRSWALDAHVEIPKNGADGPIVVMGGDMNGWSLYLNEGVPTFCYNLAAMEYTYIRAQKALAPGQHVVRYEFEKRGKEPFGAGGVGRIFVDGQKVAEGEIPTTAAFGYSLDETFDVGCDKGAPVTTEYEALASFTGKIVRIDMDLSPDLASDALRHSKEQFAQALLRQ